MYEVVKDPSPVHLADMPCVIDRGMIRGWQTGRVHLHDSHYIGAGLVFPKAHLHYNTLTRHSLSSIEAVLSNKQEKRSRLFNIIITHSAALDHQ